MPIHNKKFDVLGWVLLLVGGVLAVDGLLQLVAGNSDRTGEAALGGVLAMLSSLSFILARRKQVAVPD